jgi:hypothetical protein
LTKQTRRWPSAEPCFQILRKRERQTSDSIAAHDPISPAPWQDETKHDETRQSKHHRDEAIMTAKWPGRARPFATESLRGKEPTQIYEL